MTNSSNVTRYSSRKIIYAVVVCLFVTCLLCTPVVHADLDGLDERLRKQKATLLPSANGHADLDGLDLGALLLMLHLRI
jgi:hypothetical protein